MVKNNANTPRRGAKVKELNTSTAGQLVSKIIKFLRLFMAETVAKRIISAVLLSVGTQDAMVAELTGVSERSIRDIRKKLRDGIADDSLFRSSGVGRERKMKDVESLISEQIARHDYHTQQEIADMVFEEHGIKVHRSTVSRMLKKTASEG